MGEDPQFDSAAVLVKLAKLTSALEELTRTLAKSSERPEESDEKADAKAINSRFCDDQRMRTDFIRSDLRKLRKSPEIIADKRYKGEWGPYWKDDPLKSS
jgi:hypothetical protein